MNVSSHHRPQIQWPQIIFMGLITASISLWQASAMQESQEHPESYDKICQALKSHNPEPICLTINEFAHEKDIVQTVKTCLHDTNLSLANIKNNHGETALFRACVLHRKMEAAIEIMLEATDDDQLFQLLMAEWTLREEDTAHLKGIDTRSYTTILHFIAPDCLTRALTAVINAADRCLQAFPDKREALHAWIIQKSDYDRSALELAIFRKDMNKENGKDFECFDAFIEILQHAEEKYRQTQQ